MKTRLIIFIWILTGCNNSHETFVLQDLGEEKFYLTDTIKVKIKEGIIGRHPLIAIDGVEFQYKKRADTIILPIKKNEVTEYLFLNKESSPIIYGEKADNGAIIINTIALQSGTDTIRNK
jgi:hypothetical protein